MDRSPLQRQIETVNRVMRRNLERLGDYVGEPDPEALTRFFALPAAAPTSAPPSPSGVGFGG